MFKGYCIGHKLVCMYTYTPLKLRLYYAGIRISTLQTTEFGSRNQETLKSFFKPISEDQHAATNACANAAIHSAQCSSDERKIDENLHTTTTNTCPVCGSQVSSENLILNQHIDECLNKSTIEEVTGRIGGHLNTDALCVRSTTRNQRNPGGSAFAKEKRRKLA